MGKYDKENAFLPIKEVFITIIRLQRSTIMLTMPRMIAVVFNVSLYCVDGGGGGTGGDEGYSRVSPIRRTP